MRSGRPSQRRRLLQSRRRRRKLTSYRRSKWCAWSRLARCMGRRSRGAPCPCATHDTTPTSCPATTLHVDPDTSRAGASHRRRPPVRVARARRLPTHMVSHMAALLGRPRLYKRLLRRQGGPAPLGTRPQYRSRPSRFPRARAPTRPRRLGARTPRLGPARPNARPLEVPRPNLPSPPGGPRPAVPRRPRHAPRHPKLMIPHRSIAPSWVRMPRHTQPSLASALCLPMHPRKSRRPKHVRHSPS